jgi:Holliday junction resolvase RusA-like endonuclease
MTTTERRATPLTIIVPLLPPTANHAWLPNGRGGKRISPEYDAFRIIVMAEARETARLTGWTLPDGGLQLTLLLTFDTRRKSDIDNRVKCSLDSLALALGFDDSRIDRIVIERVGVDPKRPLTEMILEGRS